MECTRADEEHMVSLDRAVSSTDSGSFIERSGLGIGPYRVQFNWFLPEGLIVRDSRFKIQDS